MNINIKATNIELTDDISLYVNTRLESIEKFVNNDISGHVEVGKTTNHHKQGEVFKAEFSINVAGKKFYILSEKEDLFVAIDDAKNELVRKITDNKNKERTLFRRGAISVKKMLKGISKRNPFTSKY